MEDQIERLIERLRSAREQGQGWEEATDVPRREWALLRVYTLHLGNQDASKWLAPFDDPIAESVLGTQSAAWHSSRRREATQFFFTHFGLEEFKSLPMVATMLRDAWNSAGSKLINPAEKCWAENATLLFSTVAPDAIAGEWRPGESVAELGDRFHIHEDGRFRDCLSEALILRRLNEIPLFADEPLLFDLCQRDKEKQFQGGRRLGSRAVEVIVRRVIKEANGNWEETWSQKLVPLACDPRTLAPAEQQRWWGWATNHERETAIRGLTGLNIQEFIRLLEASLRGTGSSHQFPRRRDFLLHLFGKKVIQEARLVVHNDIYYELDIFTRDSLQPSRSSGGGQKTSFICLKCSSEVYLIEGTHNFGLRGFVGSDHFPISNFWRAIPQFYEDNQLRVRPDLCDLYQIHHQGDWQGDFLWKLRSNYHIEWPEMS